MEASTFFTRNGIRKEAHKLSCDPNTPCQQCRIVLNNARSFFEPCYREKLEQVTLSRHGNGNFGQRDVAFVDYFWLDKNALSKNLEIRWSLPSGRSIDLPLLKVTCKEFVPTTNDTHYITWNVDKEVITIELPPFAGDDTDSLKSEVGAFLDKSMTKTLEYILHDTTDEIALSTLREAIRFNEEHHSLTIDLALRIRCASFCSQGWGSISGAESLGIKAVDFNEHGKSGYAAYDRGLDKPLPLSIDHQLDVALLLTIKEYKQKLLQQLSKMIFSKTKRPWYEIFLTVFVLLSNFEKHAATCYSLIHEMIEEYN
ncbi:hypothetical protein DL95DRAFT_470843 [Leptodontidium sp. 2 PMI_412]|nr:hypothetical protein DL95DRAFT_470843 [Leptodontidium sp. 2 PMI_412]